MRYVKDLEGKQIEVTDLHEAIKQANMFTTFDTRKVELTAYWKDLHSKLLELKASIEAEPILVVDEPQGEDLLPLIVREIREERRNSMFLLNNPDEYKGKLFIKNDKRSPLYGAHSCVKTEENLNRLSKLEVGETWDRGNFSHKITRIY